MNLLATLILQSKGYPYIYSENKQKGIGVDPTVSSVNARDLLSRLFVETDQGAANVEFHIIY